jgi:transcriptional regulator with XRE-family HTH domain
MSSRAIDCGALGRELVRALRGKHSQTAVSRWLGYTTNALYRWESGQDAPTAARFFVFATRCKVDVAAAQHRFWRGSTYVPVDLTQPSGVAALLRQLRGKVPIATVAQRAGATRSQVSRWLSGATEPRLPQFLAVVEVLSLRLLDFVAELVDAALLPSVSEEHRTLEALRQAAHSAPWTQAILRCFELEDFDAPDHLTARWIADRIGIEEAAVGEGLRLLELTGQIARREARYHLGQALAIDTRRDAESSRAQRLFWLEVGQARLMARQPGLWSYNVFGVSKVDLVRLQQLHASYYSQMRAIIANSEPVETVAVACSQIFALDAPFDQG